ncbi:MAG: hypothetical protein FIA90_14070 [candidate division NC10 bacterium]|nr:hypothetical protein [Candidatus Methylomirabilis sp.]NJD69747.1 hypothetical protein [candidate division NC10 bacterium]
MGFALGAPVAMAGDTELMLTGPNSKVAQKAKISGSTLMLLGQNGKWVPAPNATYATADGKKIIVVNGAIVSSGMFPHVDPTGGAQQRKKDASDPKEGTSGGTLRRALDDPSKNK